MPSGPVELARSRYSVVSALCTALPSRVTGVEALCGRDTLGEDAGTGVPRVTVVRLCSGLSARRANEMRLLAYR